MQTGGQSFQKQGSCAWHVSDPGPGESESSAAKRRILSPPRTSVPGLRTQAASPGLSTLPLTLLSCSTL